VNALLGRGAARTKGPFDPHLQKVFQDALNNLEVAEQTFPPGSPEIEDARNALLGGRPPASQNINIIETAQAANNNFRRQLDARASFSARTFSPSSDTQGSGISRPDDMVASNGERFNPDKIEGSSANQLAFSDLAQARDVIVQLNKMLVTPPLTLLVNPEQLTITYAKKQIYTDRNRFNYIFQSWGEDQPRLNITGKSGGFVAAASRVTNFRPVGLGEVETDSVSGYQYASKWDSIAWQNLMSLFAFYRNNGYIYDGGGAGGGKSEAHLFVGNIEITYDQWVYVGNFENFQYQYSEDKQQGAVEFSFDFVVSFMFDRAQAGEIQKWKSPTPSPSEERDANRARASAEFDSIVGAGANANYTQTIPDGFGGQPSTCILDPQCNPFAPRGPSFGVTLDPLEPFPGFGNGFPTGGSNP
jgi:hypothetical protein